ncbi:MAG TPA: hypothetical protein VGS19_34290 [Streptosporangiaceae bacterium]|nr:hypothetical protein [Streptosporangiaceae bacterium]
MGVTSSGATPFTHYVMPLPQSSDLGVTASTYASFAEIMTGFSFAALAIYLAYERSEGSHSADGKRGPGGPENENERQPPAYRDLRGRLPVEVGQEYPIRRDQVAGTLFYSMASLAVSSFLYASLTAQVGDLGKFDALLLLYGTIFGTSVLSFFYALTLMTHGNWFTHWAARPAYWVVVVVGPAVVMRFLADAAQATWDQGCTQCTPSDWSPPLVTGMVLVFALLLFSYLISRSHVFENWPRLARLCNWLCVRPSLPAGVVFGLAATVAVAAVLIAEPASYHPSPGLILAIVWGGACLMALFALTCGCVIGPRMQRSRVPRASGQGPSRNGG